MIIVNWKECGRCWLWSNLILFVWRWLSTENLSQDSQCYGIVSNQGPPEYCLSQVGQFTCCQMSTENVNKICNIDFVLCQSKAVILKLRSHGTQKFRELGHDLPPLKSSVSGAFPVFQKRIKVESYQFYTVLTVFQVNLNFSLSLSFILSTCDLIMITMLLLFLLAFNCCQAL